jgi:hypothetical protein
MGNGEWGMGNGEWAFEAEPLDMYSQAEPRNKDNK